MGAAPDTARETTTSADGKYGRCFPAPVDCETGDCIGRFELRASRDGFRAASGVMDVHYNHWWFNIFEAPDLVLEPE